MNPLFLAQVTQSAENMMQTIQHLDWQLTNTKHIIRKYKDLTIAQQLQINAQAVKLGTLKISKDSILSKCNELKDLVSQYQHKMIS